MAERAKGDTKNCRFEMVPNRTKATLWPILEKNIDLNTIIFSDGWAAYKGLSEKFDRHHYCNHSKAFVNFKDHVYLPYLEKY